MKGSANQTACLNAALECDRLNKCSLGVFPPDYVWLWSEEICGGLAYWILSGNSQYIGLQNREFSLIACIYSKSFEFFGHDSHFDFF